MNSVKLNNFSVDVRSNDCKVKKRHTFNGNYFVIKNGSTYKLILGNHNSTQCDCHVWIDNEKMGVFRINPHSEIVLERPNNVKRKFTLFSENSDIAKDNGAISGDHYNGLVKVEFRPERKESTYLIGSPFINQSYNSSTYSWNTDKNSIHSMNLTDACCTTQSLSNNYDAP